MEKKKVEKETRQRAHVGIGWVYIGCTASEMSRCTVQSIRYVTFKMEVNIYQDMTEEQPRRDTVEVEKKMDEDENEYGGNSAWYKLENTKHEPSHN